MFAFVRLLRAAVIALGLASLAVVLVPRHTEPLWDWTSTIAGLAGSSHSLPTFSETQHWSALALATFVFVGIAYNLWRDRRQRRLHAEYDYRTGASHLREKVADLQAQLRRAVAERDKWEGSYLSLHKKHVDALVASKEHEVRSEFGRIDREALSELRKELDALLRSKGHIDGFREALHYFLAHMSEPGHTGEVIVEATANGLSVDGPGKDHCVGLPFTPPQGS
jgi:hypothetical protein